LLGISDRHFRRIAKAASLTSYRIMGIGRPRYRRDDVVNLLRVDHRREIKEAPAAAASEIDHFINRHVRST